MSIIWLQLQLQLVLFGWMEMAWGHRLWTMDESGMNQESGMNKIHIKRMAQRPRVPKGPKVQRVEKIHN